MPRRARVSLPGIAWHIVQRGNNRAACFQKDDDYRLYLHHLERLSKKFECALHAYVLMTNHVHLLLTPTEKDSAGLMMKQLGQIYAQYVNRAYERTGTLWEGRFRSCLMQNKDYVLACYRYIEMNPVRAGIVSDPGQYSWSSHLANVQGSNGNWLRPHNQYLKLGSDQQDRRQNYRKLFQTELDEESITQFRKATNGNYALGDQRFQNRVEKLSGRRAEWKKPGRPVKTKNQNGLSRRGGDVQR